MQSQQKPDDCASSNGEIPMVRFTDSLDTLTPDQLEGFFVDWPNPPSPATHLELLKNSDEVILAVAESTGAVVGFITAITDQVLTAYIPLLEVLPAYQHHGIGKQLVEKMLHKLRHLYMVDLLCDPDLQGFYIQFEMIPTTGMIMRRYENQAGVLDGQ
jgi:ribosomal protein S18 acetylase RimI-like enzyme